MHHKSHIKTFREVADLISFRMSPQGIQLAENRAIRKMINSAMKLQQIDLTDAICFIALILDVEPHELLPYLTDRELEQLKEENG
jgi:hypothetical protein